MKEGGKKEGREREEEKLGDDNVPYWNVGINYPEFMCRFLMTRHLSDSLIILSVLLNCNFLVFSFCIKINRIDILCCMYNNVTTLYRLS